MFPHCIIVVLKYFDLILSFTIRIYVAVCDIVHATFTHTNGFKALTACLRMRIKTQQEA